MITFNSFSGTGVGSPFIQQLPAFDYQMAFPFSWKVLDNDISGDEGLFKEWIASNEPKVGSDKKSEISIEFLKHFPANNLSELYSIIQKRHPSFSFRSSTNIQISGWTSALRQNGHTYENWEYYFIAPQKVVRIHTLRKKEGHGLSHVEIILRSIRKISKGIELTHAKFQNTSGPTDSIHIGDKVCYYFSFDYPKKLQTEEMISGFKLKYEKENSDFPINKKILKTRSYNQTTGIHSVCFEILAGMNVKDHLPNEMTYVMGGSHIPQRCLYKDQRMNCNNASQSLKVPTLSTFPVDRKGPEVSSFSFNREKNSLKMAIEDLSDIKMIQIFGIGINDTNQKRIGVIFADEIVNNEINFKFKKEFAPATFISSIYFTDKSENTSVLMRNNDSDLFYSFKQLNTQAIKTNFSIVGW
jgi:hypothetical protein